jgi:pyruvate dehydrogenase E1 component
LLHPTQPPRQSYLQQLLAKEEGPFVAASDYLRSVPEMIARWVPGGLCPLGTDGFGRSDTRAALRRHFEVDAECIAYAALAQLAARGQYRREALPQALEKLGINPEKISPMGA